MRRYEKIEQEIAKVLADRAVAGYCLAIVNFIVSNDEQLSRHLTYRHLSQILKVEASSDELQAAISLLCSRFKALRFHMEFFDEEGATYDLSDAELSYFFRTGMLAHPHTGQIIKDPSEHLVPYLSASKKELLSDIKND